MMPIFYIPEVCTIELSMELCFELSMMTITSNHAWWVIKVTFYSHGSWFITKCGNVQRTFLEILLNKHICHRRNIVKNSFGILKIFFWKLLVKINLHLLFLVNMVICCCIIYDMILNNKNLNIDELMLQLELENCANRSNLVLWQREQWIPVELTNPNNKEEPKYKEQKYERLVHTTYNWNNYLQIGHIKI